MGDFARKHAWLVWFATGVAWGAVLALLYLYFWGGR